MEKRSSGQSKALPSEIERACLRLPPDEGTNTIPAGIVPSVVLYHGNEHHGQICTTLSAHGHEPPDLTPWAYAFASGRIRE
jgi:uncharacterized damage-inducible protein DinB